MMTSCTPLVTVRFIEYPCPDGEETLDLDDTKAEEIPGKTNSETDIPTTLDPLGTAFGPTVGTTPRDVVTTPRVFATSSRDVDTFTTATPSTINPEDINASVEMTTTTEAVSEATKIADSNNSVEEPEVVIEESGDSFMPEEIDSDDFLCKPNLSFKLECNTCWCRSDGKGPRYCTRIACKPKTYRPLTQQRNLL